MDGCYQGRVALGEYTLSLDKVKKMVFQPAAERRGPAIRIVQAGSGDAEDGSLPRLVIGKGDAPRVVTGNRSEPLKKIGRPLPEGLLLDVEDDVPFAIVKETFVRLAERGVREVRLLP